jgi:hypothetical protein
MNTAKESLCNMLNSQNIAGNIANEQYHISQRTLMLSRDIEFNPGPGQNNSPTSRRGSRLMQLMRVHQSKFSHKREFRVPNGILHCAIFSFQLFTFFARGL